jgi:hypothetical protein
MPHCKQLTLEPEHRACSLPFALLLVLLALVPKPLGAQAAAGHAPVANLRDSPLSRSRTPQEVLNGTAKLVGHYEPGNKLRLVLGIAPPKLAEEEKFLRELQDRNSPNFHKYLTAEQWNARFAPSAKDEQAVVDWATSNGLTVTQRYPHRLIVDVEGTSETIEKAFGVTINSYQLAGSTEFSNDRDPVIPAQLSGILHSVGGLNSIQRVHAPHEGDISRKNPAYSPGNTLSIGEAPPSHTGNKAALEAARSATAANAGSTTLKEKALPGGVQPGVTNGFLDPTDIYSSYAYDFDALQALGHCCNPYNVSGGAPPTTSVAVATAGDFANSDLLGWYATYPYLAALPHRIYKDGTPACCNDETTLDLEWVIATSNSFGSEYSTSQTWIYEGANNLLSTFTDVYSQMLADGNARVFSTSWGCAELVCTDSGTMDTDHGIFNSMIGQGWTILALSHDYGTTGACDDAYRVDYPASDPDVTGVGGTSLALYTDGTFDSETGWTGGTASGSCSRNDGGSGGGCSAYYTAPSYQNPAYCGANNRSVPDIALNAGYGQNFYFNGQLSGVGGTSISTPQAAGFMAQANAYLLAIGIDGYPLGEVNPVLYYQGNNQGGEYAGPHYPYYDITSGCSSNDVTAEFDITPFCSASGYDAVTGWGSFNALQLAWAINSYYLGAFVPPTITFSGPFSGANGSDHWYNTDQTVSWTVTSNAEDGLTPTGVAGYTAVWDNYIFDPTSEAEQGTGNSFYSGPEYPNSSSGSLDLASAGQGCHFATVDAWDNAGYTPGEQFYFYVCYDTVPPVTTASLSGTVYSGTIYDSAVKVSLSASDASSGVANTYYSIDGSGYAKYSGTLTVSALGAHTVNFYSVDVAGNIESAKTASFSIESLTTTTIASSLNPSVYGQSVTFTAKVKAALGGTPTGIVRFFRSGTLVGTENLSGGVATLSLSNLSTNPHSMTAKYEGNGLDLVSVSSGLNQVVDQASSTTAVVSSVNPSEFGQPVTFTATISPKYGGVATGTVTFEKNGSSLGTATVSGNQAVFTTSSFLVATHTITAVYSGDGDVSTSTSPGLSEVTKAATTTTTLTSSVNPSSYGQSITFKATVAPAFGGTAGGTVTFKHGGTVLGTSTLSGGVATLAISNFGVGTFTITAVYNGSTDYLTSTSNAVSQTVKKAATSTTVSSSLNPAAAGAKVTFTAKVTPATGPTPTGSVSFKDGTATIAVETLSASGSATFSTTTLAAGTHSITAEYDGSTLNLASTSTVLSQVIK